MAYTVSAIGTIRTPFSEKFAIPRQPQLAMAATGEIHLQPPYNHPSSIAELALNDYIWLLFIFDKNIRATQALSVRPPRFGGNKKVGVFASRSPFRPNNIGMSLVKLDRIDHGVIYVSGVDLLNDTPIVDIKPYIPYCDSPIINDGSTINHCESSAAANSINSIAVATPITINVNWQAKLKAKAKQLHPDLPDLVEQCLAQNPKPAYQTVDTQRVYGSHFWQHSIQWQYVSETEIVIIAVSQAR